MVSEHDFAANALYGGIVAMILLLCFFVTLAVTHPQNETAARRKPGAIKSLGLMRGWPEFSTHVSNQSEIVNFCALVDSPALYHGRTIRLKAVLVENNNKMVVDGADPSLYDPACRNKKRKVVVGWSNESYENNSASEALREIRARSDEFNVSRASVVMSGKLSGPRKEKFGHLGWADLEFKIDDVERAEPVPASARWPKRIEDAYRKARKLLLSGDEK
jgi:hypothetical protein